MRELPGSQQGDAWFEHRQGRITGSRMNDLMAYMKVNRADKKKGEEAQARINYRRDLIAGRISRSVVQNKPPTYAMQWGIDNEGEAKQKFEMAVGEMLIPVGFVLHPTQDFSGVSPDGLVSGGGILEIKCPETDTHVQYIDEDRVPDEYIPQMQWEMACTEQSFGYFVSYDPRVVHPSGRFFVKTLDRDSALIEQYEAEAAKMDAEIEAWLAAHGFPPTIWNTKGDEVIHTPRDYSEAEAYADAVDAIDRTEMTP